MHSTTKTVINHHGDSPLLDFFLPYGQFKSSTHSPASQHSPVAGSDYSPVAVYLLELRPGHPFRSRGLLSQLQKRCRLGTAPRFCLDFDPAHGSGCSPRPRLHRWSRQHNRAGPVASTGCDHDTRPARRAMHLIRTIFGKSCV